jgi:hypothetical protein
VTDFRGHLSPVLAMTDVSGIPRGALLLEL